MVVLCRCEQLEHSINPTPFWDGLFFVLASDTITHHVR
ncbi:hypothetical protein NBRC111894_3727 [Sporolactobacillus inulinus]|uniref:Uncharacterized protein n=1 Tax=Sporolactobacillus inulinus TaxID=2078 RepID=A0A4Y1ZGU1_9BACL|nr:hypothetical protein NBRC111894_3727 [Sporolactobacillus inulinus]